MVKAFNSKAGKALFISVHGDPEAELGGIQAGGQNVYVRELAAHLARRGWKIDVFTRRTDPESPHVSAFAPGARTVRLAAGPPAFVAKEDLWQHLPDFLRGLCRHVAARGGMQQYAVIHSNYHHSGWVGMQLRRHFGLPQVHTSHSLGVGKAAATGQSGLLRRRIAVEGAVLRGAGCAVATTPWERQVITQDYGVAAARVRVIPCGFDPAVFRPRGRSEARALLGGGLATTDRPVIIFAGRFEETKGLGVLVEALPLLTTLLGCTPLLLVAGGAGAADAAAGPVLGRLAELRLRAAVRFLGPRNQRDLALYLAAADVCAVPSYYETFGLVALEAMACGCPVVAARVGGLQHVVADGRSGFLVPPRDAGALAQRLAWVLQNPDLRRRFARAGVRRARAAFRWQQVAHQMDHLYTALQPREVSVHGAAHAAPHVG